MSQSSDIVRLIESQEFAKAVEQIANSLTLESSNVRLGVLREAAESLQETLFESKEEQKVLRFTNGELQGKYVAAVKKLELKDIRIKKEKGNKVTIHAKPEALKILLSLGKDMKGSLVESYLDAHAKSGQTVTHEFTVPTIAGDIRAEYCAVFNESRIPEIYVACDSPERLDNCLRSDRFRTALSESIKDSFGLPKNSCVIFDGSRKADFLVYKTNSMFAEQFSQQGHFSQARKFDFEEMLGFAEIIDIETFTESHERIVITHNIAKSLLRLAETIDDGLDQINVRLFESKATYEDLVKDAELANSILETTGGE